MTPTAVIDAGMSSAGHGDPLKKDKPHEAVLEAPVPQASAPVISASVKRRLRNDRILRIVAPLLGLLLSILLWEIISKTGKTIPGPGPTWQAAVQAFSDPFYVNGPNDQGIGFKILNSLGRVGVGFGMAALVGIPLGFMI